MAKPMIARPTVNIKKSGATPITTAPTVKTTELIRMTGLLPTLSFKNPPDNEPTTAPIVVILTINSCSHSLNFKSFLIESNAPETTPVSYPNNKEDTAQIPVNKKMYNPAWTSFGDCRRKKGVLS